MVQWNHACFGVRGVSKRMGSNPVHVLSVAYTNTTLPHQPCFSTTGSEAALASVPASPEFGVSAVPP
ncbi:hypothetical protein E2C01_016154 [Portunus trituberculatus]|uniref:Uncharacterized protein n=1 Tax=Portunus trituberculatus TaxID=210409 RepID=A0A5B7DPI1_PORTR|nr:hypothetical protein [Portunus trituberculatus]